jgi:hypothetical protein
MASTVAPPTNACQTCLVAFRTRDVLLQHYDCQWHAYNLKRRTGALPPVTLEAFTRRKEEALQRRRAAAAAARPRIFCCTLTGKRFKALPQLEQHLRSRKFQEKLTAARASGRFEGSVSTPLRGDSLPPFITTRYLDDDAAAVAEEAARAAMEARMRDFHEKVVKMTIHNTCFLDMTPVANVSE